MFFFVQIASALPIQNYTDVPAQMAEVGFEAVIEQTCSTAGIADQFTVGRDTFPGQLAVSRGSGVSE